MVASSKIYQQPFHGPNGEQLLLSCDETGCLVEIRIPGSVRNRLTAEILVQPKDSRGLPLGPVVELCRNDIILLPVPGRGCLVGRFWLPGAFRWPAAMNCYFRLSNIRATGPAETSESCDV